MRRRALVRSKRGATVSTALVKPVGDRCNLACRYCYYHPSSGRIGAAPSSGRPGAVMEEATLAAMTREFLAEGSPTVFAWQGGEPTLAGLGFYRRAVELQRGLAGEAQQVVNTFQTNGLLVDDEWAGFLAEQRFLVGLSLDGPADCHDMMRVDAGGAGSHARVVAAWERLGRHGCEANILCVVHGGNCGRAGELYEYFTRELGASHVQFVPCVEWEESGEPAGFSLRPGEYGRFLVELFEVWAGETEREVSVKLFDDLVLALAGKPMRDCMHAAGCDSHLVVEREGWVYPCDFFVGPEYVLGNVVEEGLAEIRGTARARAFRERKASGAPAECASCRHLEICRGGCPKFWREGAGGGVEQYLCGDMRLFFDAKRAALEGMAKAVRERWREWGVDE